VTASTSSSRRAISRPWSRADLHLHTTHSDGRHPPERLAAEILRSRLAVVAVTDHDTVAGALDVEEALAGEGPEVVIGTEVSSADGHILALFIDRDIPRGLRAEATIAAIHDRGGVAVAAHPYSLSLGVGDLAAQLDFDAVELVNGAPLMEVANARAVRRLSGTVAAGVGGSDAHVAQAVGGVHTLFPGETAADLRAALLAGTTRPALDRGRHLAALPAHTAWLAWLLLARRRSAGAPGRGRGIPPPTRARHASPLPGGGGAERRRGRPYDQTAV
jgi:predicted metal-dependent phosphoesterase TrpH